MTTFSMKAARTALRRHYRTNFEPGNRMTRPKMIAAALCFALAAPLASCDSPADVASQNLSQAADNFEIVRRIVFYNGITGGYILVIEGRCSLGNFDTNKRMSVTCMTGPSQFKKDFLGLSDNVTFFAEQLETAKSDTYHYRVFFKPSEILPTVSVQ